MEHYNGTVLLELSTYVSEHPKEWNRYVSLLTTAYSMQVHTRTEQPPLAFVSPRRLNLFGMERLPKVRPLTEAPEGEDDLDDPATTVAEWYVQDVKELALRVRKHLGKAQDSYKEAFDRRVKDKNNSIAVGDWIYTAAHANMLSKLAFKTEGPYMVLKTDGQRFLVESPKGLRTLSSAHITVAPPPPDGDRAWAREKGAQTNFALASPDEERPEYMLERFVPHRRGADGVIQLLVRWFVYYPQEVSWKRATSLPGEAVRKYFKRKRIDLPGVAHAGVYFCETLRSQVRRRRDLAAQARKKRQKRAQQRSSLLYAGVTRGPLAGPRK